MIYPHIIMVLPHTEKIADSEAPAIHLAIERLSQIVRREAYRMNGLVRFAKMENDLILAVINSRYDVLPLVRRHFEKRHSDQRWVIFDSVRNYGLYFDMQEALEVRPDSGLLSLGADVCNAHDEACRLCGKPTSMPPTFPNPATPNSTFANASSVLTIFAGKEFRLT